MNAPTMFSVFLDTSVLPQHPSRLGVAFERMCELAKLGIIQVYVSEIVAQEWRSRLRDALAEDLQKADTAVQRILRHPWIQCLSAHNQIVESQASIYQTLQDIDEISKAHVDELLDRLQATILPVSEAHGAAVIEAYFQGIPPFKKAKSREDFPDAFVYFCASDLCQRISGNIFCLVADKTLKNALGDLDDVELFSDARDFVQADFVKAEALKQEIERRWEEIFDRIQPFFPQIEKEVLSVFLKNQLYSEGVTETYIEHHDIPEDNSEALITGVYEPFNVDFDWDSVEDYGAGLITVPVEYYCKADLEFLVYRADTFDVPEGVYVEIGDFELDHYFEASGSVIIKVSASLSINFNIENNNEGDLPEIISIAIDDIGEITICDTNSGGIFHYDTASLDHN